MARVPRKAQAPSPETQTKVGSLFIPLRLGEVSHYKPAARLSGSKAGGREGVESRMCGQQYPFWCKFTF